MLFIFNSSIEEVLSKIKEIIATKLQIEISAIKENKSLFNLGCDYIDVADICNEIEKNFFCLPIVFDFSNFYKLDIKAIVSWIKKTEEDFKASPESLKLIIHHKVIQFLQEFYKSRNNEDCPMIKGDVDFGIDYGMNSLDLVELQHEIERFFQVNFQPKEIGASPKLSELVNMVFIALTNKFSPAVI